MTTLSVDCQAACTKCQVVHGICCDEGFGENRKSEKGGPMVKCDLGHQHEDPKCRACCHDRPKKPIPSLTDLAAAVRVIECWQDTQPSGTIQLVHDLLTGMREMAEQHKSKPVDLEDDRTSGCYTGEGP